MGTLSGIGCGERAEALRACRKNVNRQLQPERLEIPRTQRVLWKCQVGREKKAITSGERGRDLGGKVDREWRGRGTCSSIG